MFHPFIIYHNVKGYIFLILLMYRNIQFGCLDYACTKSIKQCPNHSIIISATYIRSAMPSKKTFLDCKCAVKNYKKWLSKDTMNHTN